MGKYAIFVCSNGNYLQYLNVLFNSLDKYNIDIDVHLLHYQFSEDYIKDAKNVFSFNLIPTEIKKSDFNIHSFNENNKNLFIKQSRFKYIEQLGGSYDVICMLDGDMFVTSKNILNLFDMVNGTNKLIACNERFKWNFNQNYVFNESPIFPTPIKAHKFHCSVPIIFNLNEWMDVFNTYNQLAYNSFDLCGSKQKAIGDIFCWNISVYRCNRQDDVVLFPMETMTQVHQTNAEPWVRLIKVDDYWKTFAGDEVFFIHGRIGRPGYREMHTNKLNKTIEENSITSPLYIKKLYDFMNRTLRTIEKEWYALNTKGKLNIYDYIELNQYWETLQ